MPRLIELGIFLTLIHCKSRNDCALFVYVIWIAYCHSILANRLFRQRNKVGAFAIFFGCEWQILQGVRLRTCESMH